MNINSSSKIKNLFLIFYINLKEKNLYIYLIFEFYTSFKNRINFHSEFYYCTEKEWRFFNKPQGLYAYVKGFQKEKSI